MYGQELFLEYNSLEGVAKYNLSREDYKNTLSLYKLYMLADEPSEYNFANKYFEGWRHWEQIAGANWIKDKLELWREELAIKLQAEAVANVIRISKAGGKDALTAAKYVAERGWEKSQKRPVGRPLKSPDVLKEARRILDENELVEDDAQRIMISANIN